MMDFEWDSKKAASNIRKYSASFSEAKSVFQDPLAWTALDPDGPAAEPRFISLGMSRPGRLLLVVHTDRPGVIRLISARPVSKAERRIYEEG
jgi:uncharacterized DUF497 family protein